jgi:hypothetical protein
MQPVRVRMGGDVAHGRNGNRPGESRPGRGRGVAGQAAVNLSAVPGADDDLGLSFAALDVSYALTELESMWTDAARAVLALDLGAVALDDRVTAVAIIDDLLAAAERLAIDLASRPDVAAPVVLRAGRVLALLGSARAKATGGVW